MRCSKFPQTTLKNPLVLIFFVLFYGFFGLPLDKAPFCVIYLCKTNKSSYFMVNIITNTNKFCEIEIGANKVPTYSIYINKRTCYVKVMVYDPFSDLLDGYTKSAELVILPVFLRHLKSIGNLMTGENIDRRLFRMLINFLNI